MEELKLYMPFHLVCAAGINLLGEYINTINIQTIYWLRARSNNEQVTFEDCFLLFCSESFSSRLISKTLTITYRELQFFHLCDMDVKSGVSSEGRI